MDDEDDTSTIVVITDTSVLINFLVLDRVALLASLPDKRFVVTNHVRAEVTDHFPQQLKRLEFAFEQQHLEEIEVTEFQEVELFALLSSFGLGTGECSAMAVAILRGFFLGMDDKRAIKKLSRHYPKVSVLTTELLMLELIREDILTITDADSMKVDWEKHHRFLLKFDSFADRL